MKTKLTILAMVLMIIASCNQKPKNSIEERFDRYLVAENLNKDFLSIDSIILIDSVSLTAHIEQLMAYNDSVKAELFKAFRRISDNLDKVPRTDAVIYMELLSKFNDLTKRDSDKDIKEKISIFLEDIPENKSWYANYKIFAKFKDGQREYYAHNIAFEDTITITEERPASSRKLDRFTGYCVDYMVDVSAPKNILLDNVKEFAKDSGISLLEKD